MAQFSSEERIARVEQAPAEVQVKVAKAFLRDDIDDEIIQTEFTIFDNSILENNSDIVVPEGEDE